MEVWEDRSLTVAAQLGLRRGLMERIETHKGGGLREVTARYGTVPVTAPLGNGRGSVTAASISHRAATPPSRDRQGAVQPITIGVTALSVANRFSMPKERHPRWRATALVILSAALCARLCILSARPEETPKHPVFVDVAPRSRISYKSNNSPDSRKYFPKPMCGGVALFDFDNDGKLDIFFTNGAKLPDLKKTDPSYYNCLLKQRNDGTFEDVTAKAGLLASTWISTLAWRWAITIMTATRIYSSAAPAATLCITTTATALSPMSPRSSGIGGKPPDTLSVEAAWFDYDNDGLLDLVMSNYTIWTPQTDLRCTMGGQEYLLRPAPLLKRPAAALSQSGPWQIRGRHRKIGLGEIARQRHGHLHCGFQ